MIHLQILAAQRSKHWLWKQNESRGLNQLLSIFVKKVGFLRLCNVLTVAGVKDSNMKLSFFIGRFHVHMLFDYNTQFTKFKFFDYTRQCIDEWKDIWHCLLLHVDIIATLIFQ